MMKPLAQGHRVLKQENQAGKEVFLGSKPTCTTTGSQLLTASNSTDLGGLRVWIGLGVKLQPATLSFTECYTSPLMSLSVHEGTGSTL